MTFGRNFDQELRSIRGLLAGAALDRALLGLQREHLEGKNWETQPRAPARQPDGGRWIKEPGGAPQRLPPTSWATLTDGKPDADQKPAAQTESTTLADGTRVLSIRIRAGRGEFDEQHAIIAPDGESRIFETSGATQTIRDGQSGEILSRTTFTPTELTTEPVVQPAFLQAVPLGLAAGITALRTARTLELALSLLSVLSAKKDSFGAVLGLTAHEYSRTDQNTESMVAWVGQLSQQQLDVACPRNGEVRAITNDVARSVRASGLYRTARDFGNQVHIGIKNVVTSMHDPNLKAELLLAPTGIRARANEKGNLRLDLLEYVSANKTVCVYDYKTGERGLGLDRALSFAASVFANYGEILRVVIIQMRPEI